MAQLRIQSLLLRALWYIGLSLAASIVIASGMFAVYLNLSLRGEPSIGLGDIAVVWVIPFIACIATGVAAGNVKEAVKIAVPIIFFSLIIAVFLACMPVAAGMIADIAAQNLFIMSVITTNFYLFLILIWAIFPGCIIGGMLAGG